jgi:Sulfotransferase family
LAVTERPEYEALFAHAGDKPVRGESSVFYLYVPGTAERIARELPNVKLIALLRNPVQRALSAYQHLAREGRVTRSFARALAEEERYVSEHYEPTWHFTRCGLYHEQLQRYLDVFDRRQLGIYIHDDFQAHPGAFIRDVLGFLGVDPTVILDTARRANQTDSLPRNRALHRTLLRWARPTRALVPGRVRTWLFTRPPGTVRRDVARRLVDRFRPEVRALEELLKRDLSAWLSVS